MGQAVVVFSFPEPKDSITLGLIIESAKRSFDNMKEVKIHLAINEVADNVIAIFDPLHKPDGNLVEHARRELALVGNDEDFDKAIIGAVRAFASYGHSGGSAEVGIHILNDLLQFRALSPLTDDPTEWNRCEVDCWQSTRQNDAFSKDGGKTYYLLSDGSDSTQQNKMYTSLQKTED